MKYHGFEFRFVDRKSELKKIFDVLLHDLTNYRNEKFKLKLPITGQMFGLGKTTFGLNLLDNRNTNVREILDADPILYNPLLNVSTITVDLQKEVPKKLEDLDEYLSRILFMRTLDQYFNISDSDATKYWKEHNFSLNDCINVLQKLMSGRSLLFHLDEIGALEEYEFNGMFVLNLTPYDQERYSSLTMKQKVLIRYYDVWWCVNSMMRKGVLFYCSGKSLALDAIGRNKLPIGQSPGIAVRMDLSCFAVDDIVAILGNSKMDIATGSMITVTDYLGVSNNNVQKLGNWIYKLTSGIPRLVMYMLECLFENKFTFEFDNDKLVDFNDILEAKVFDAIIKAPGCMPSDINDKLFEKVLSYASIQYEFKDDDYLPGDTEMDSTAAELALKYSIYTSRTSPGKFKYIMPLLWIRRANLPLLTHWEFLNNPVIASKGMAFEKLFEHSFKTHCKWLPLLATYGAYFPYLALTCVKDCVVYDTHFGNLKLKIMNVNKSEAGLEKLQNDLKKSTKTNFKIDSEKVRKKREAVTKLKEKLNEYFKELLSKNNDKSEFSISFDKSSFSDFLHLLARTNMAEARKHVFYQLQNELSALTIQDIQAELGKCKQFVAVSRKGHEDEPNNAVFVLIHIGPITDDVRNKFEGKVVDAGNNTSSVIIPKGVEVVVISADKVSINPLHLLNQVKNLKN